MCQTPTIKRIPVHPRPFIPAKRTRVLSNITKDLGGEFGLFQGRTCVHHLCHSSVSAVRSFGFRPSQELLDDDELSVKC